MGDKLAVVSGSELLPMNADRAIYFLTRFKGDEKMLGPNEQMALDFAIDRLSEGTLAEVQAENSRLREALGDLMTWFPDEPSEPEWRLKGGSQGADDAVAAARAALSSGEEGLEP